MRNTKLSKVLRHFKGIEEKIIEGIDHLVGNLHIRQAGINSHCMHAQFLKAPNRVFIQRPAQIAIGNYRKAYAMRDLVVITAELMLDAMADPRSIVSLGQNAVDCIDAAIHNIGASAVVRWLRIGDGAELQEGVDQRFTHSGMHIGTVNRREVGLQRMADTINDTGSRQVRIQCERVLRVEEGNLRTNLGAMEAGLFVGRFVVQNRAGGNLRTGAGGRRDD